MNTSPTENNALDQEMTIEQKQLKRISEQILKAFKIKDQEKFLEEARKLDKELLCNKITSHLSQWNMNDTPVFAGKNFLITRSWRKNVVNEDPKYKGKKVIQIDPGIAFGWAHSTSLLTFELLEEYWQGGSLLDVGTGTGLLAIAAAFLQPESHIDAFDISIDIVETAACHLEINGVADKVNLQVSDITAYPLATYDLIAANLLPSIFLDIREELVKRLKPGGKIILSGFSDQGDIRTTAYFDWLPMVSDISNSKIYDVAEMFQQLGLELVDKRTYEHWLALLMQAPEK